MNSLQKSTITELDTIFEHIKLCIFKDSEAAIASETTLSQTNGNNFITTFLNTNDTLFTTNEARLEYINEYENINNYIEWYHLKLAGIDDPNLVQSIPKFVIDPK